MSGALETAAGAFAVVGVADVVVRTCRDLHEFFSTVKDAPESIARLQDNLRAIYELANQSKSFTTVANIRSPDHAHRSASNTVNSAFRGLMRDLDTTRKKITKVKTGQPTWSRVKYAINEREIDKTLESVEKRKADLLLAMTILAGVTSASEQASMCAAQQAISLKIDDQNQKLQSYQNSLTSKLDSQQQQLLSQQSSISSKVERNHRQLLSHQDTIRIAIGLKVNRSERNISDKLSQFQTQHSNTHATNMRALDTLLQQQDTAKKEQSRLLSVISQTRKQNMTISKRLDFSTAQLSNNYRDTTNKLNVLSQKVDHLQISLSEGPGIRHQSIRKIMFHGERPDMIMMYLLSMEDQVKYAAEQILKSRSVGVSMRQVCWLESRFRDLLASASQMDAARRTNSTARTSDHWILPKLIGAGPSSVAEESTADPSDNGTGTHLTSHTTAAKDLKAIAVRERRRRNTFWFQTPAGDVSVQLPWDDTGIADVNSVDEISLGFAWKANGTSVAANAVFLNQRGGFSQNNICAQLNIFTVLRVQDVCDQYSRVFEYKAIDDIDLSIRKGDINPYAMDDDGNYLCIWWALYHGRLDVVKYLESQGIGLSIIRDDGAIIKCLPYYSTLEDYFHIFDQVWQHVDDTLALAVAWICGDILSFNFGDITDEELMRILEHIAQKITDEKSILGLEYPDLFPNDGADHRALDEWCFLVMERLLLNPRDEHDRLSSLIPQWDLANRVRGLIIWSCTFQGRQEVLKPLFRVVGAFVQKFRRKDNYMIPRLSILARRCCCWEEWCVALEHGGKDITRLLRSTYSSYYWVLGDDWYILWNYNRSDDMYDPTSGTFAGGLRDVASQRNRTFLFEGSSWRAHEYEWVKRLVSREDASKGSNVSAEDEKDSDTEDENDQWGNWGYIDAVQSKKSTNVDIDSSKVTEVTTFPTLTSTSLLPSNSPKTDEPKKIPKSNTSVFSDAHTAATLDTSATLDTASTSKTAMTVDTAATTNTSVTTNASETLDNLSNSKATAALTANDI